MDARRPQSLGGRSVIVTNSSGDPWRELLDLRAAVDREIADLKEENAWLRRKLGIKDPVKTRAASVGRR